MNSRQRVVRSLNFQSVDKIPKDLGSHRSTGISCFAYGKLVQKLALPQRLPKIFDLGQMLSIVDPDVLDALNCDVVLVDMPKNGPYISNVLIDESQWEYFDFGGRLEALVPKGCYEFQVKSDGTLEEHKNKQKMPPGSYVFDLASGGQPVAFPEELPKLDLDQFREEFRTSHLITEKDADEMTGFLQKVRQRTDRAVHLSRSPFTSLIWPGGHEGLGIFPMICATEPDYVHAYHEILTDVALENMQMLLPRVVDYVDIIDTGHGDWGTQNSLIMSPDYYRELFSPYHRRINLQAQKIAPHIRRLVHS